MNTSKWIRCALATAVLTLSANSFAEVVVRSGQAAIWSADEADSFLNGNQIPKTARTITSNTSSIPSQYNNVDNHYSNYNNNYANSYNTSSYNNGYDAYKPEVNARAALVMDATTGEVLYSKNIESVRSIASITKLMTAIVTLDAGLNLYEQITLTDSDFAGAGGKNSSSTLRVGDTMTRSDALYLALMKSENPAAMALGRTYPGGRSAFIQAMNSKAQNLGMYSSRFADPSGLDPRNVSSARDLGIMTSTAARYGTIRHFSTSASNSFDLGYRMLNSNNTNAIVRNGGWSLDVSKTGYIKEAGRCVVMQANINSRPVVVVLLGGSDSAKRTADATRLFNWVAQQPQRL